MRIHTELDRETFAKLAPSGTYFAVLTEHGSRKRPRAYEVRLSGNGRTVSGRETIKGATWDEWGDMFGALYRLDSDAICGTAYTNADDFHHQTMWRFDGTPYQRCPRHTWEWNGGQSYTCTKCGADKDAPHLAFGA